MDRAAVLSHQNAWHAQSTGRFDDEIVPIHAFSKDPKTGERKRVLISKDDGIRGDSTFEGLSKIRAAFPQWEPSHTTGGNASQLTDGAAAVILMTRAKAKALGLKVLAKYVCVRSVSLFAALTFV